MATIDVFCHIASKPGIAIKVEARSNFPVIKIGEEITIFPNDEQIAKLHAETGLYLAAIKKPLVAGDWATHPDWEGASMQIKEIRADGPEAFAYFVKGGFWRVSQLSHGRPS